MVHAGSMPDTPVVFSMQPVLESHRPDGFDLWPVTEVERFGYLALSGGLTPAEVGMAVMRIAGCNDIDPEDDGRPLRPADPVGSFLHGLLTCDALVAGGGLRVADSGTGVVLLPGCCSGLEEWRDWYAVLDGSGPAFFGHDPSPAVERLGDIVRLTVDAEQDDSAVVMVHVDELRHLLAKVERDLLDFHALASDWLHRHLPAHAAPVAAALGRVLDVSPRNGELGAP